MKSKLTLPLIVIFLCGLMRPALADNQFSLGVEGFRDYYRESEVWDNTNYGGINAGYTYTNKGHYFLGVDGRFAYGKDNYTSISDGVSSGSPQYEAEMRLRGGPIFSLPSGVIQPYTGVGGRFFYDNSNGSTTSFGSVGYDRRIGQLYVPFGVTVHVPLDVWTFSPTLEYDDLIKGWVNSRLQNDGGFNISNRQYSGYGVRSEMMFDKNMGKYTLELGPFVRFWDVQDSNTYVAPDASEWDEPHNTRLQIGFTVRALY